MKSCSISLGLAQRLLAVAVSLAVALSTYSFAIASPAAAGNPATLNPSQSESAKNELRLTSASATATKDGVLVRWSTNAVSDNVGFNIYRVKDGQRTRANKEIIPGAMFAPGTPALNPGGYSYAWFDRGGSAAATYLIESVDVAGAARLHGAIAPVIGKPDQEFGPAAANAGNAAESADSFEKRYPAEESQPNSVSTIQDQWAIAAQTALKIAINKDGWYRVTQPQMVAAGFNPTVDIRNLRLFVDASEVAINTSQSSGTFGSGDYIEFYGRGLDTPTTDKHIYYLVAGTTPGKRVSGEIHLDGDPVLPPAPTSTPLPPVAPTPIARPVLSDPIFYSPIQNFSLLGMLDPGTAPVQSPVLAAGTTNSSSVSSPVDTAADNENGSLGYVQPSAVAADSPEVSAVDQPAAKDSDSSAAKATGTTKTTRASVASASTAAVMAPAPNSAAAQPAVKPGRQMNRRQRASKRSKRKLRRLRKPEHSHAVVAAAGFAPANYNYTVQIKERFVYFSSLLNGDEENYFGRVISGPVTQTLNVSNPDLTAAGPATLEFALQGVVNIQTNASHSVDVSLNGTLIGSVNFEPAERVVRTFPVPISLLQSGSNNLVFTKTSTGELCLVDYIRLTYPHAFKADANALKFNLRGSQTLKVDGFAGPLVQLIDYTDPLNVGISKPASEPSALGYAITVPMSESRSKDQRSLYAIQQGQFDQPAALSLSQPSTLNANSNAADFVIISHKDFIPSFTTNQSPINTTLVAQRTSQGRSVKIVDIDDVYDEFSFGVHGPQAIKDFLEYAKAHWATPPHYVIFAGDASLDPRNYQGAGDFDFVPTKLVDATYSETASDDWLTDFDDDGIADIPVGRLPVRTLADANLMISKIVNFVPPQPQTALLLADQDEFNIFGFAATNDVFQSLLPGTMTVQRLNRAPQPPGVPAQNVVKADIVNGFNSGPALVNYSGHGQVDVWTGASLFVSGDALALTNGNRLPFVVVMDCLNGYFMDPNLLSLSEALLKAPAGGAVAAFASSGLTIAQGQHDMGHELYTQLYSGAPQALGDAIKVAKGATFDIDVKRTWIFFGDPSLKIR
jgi:hypothetical protein